MRFIAACSLLCLIGCATVRARSQNTFSHTFVYHADRDLTSVTLAGTFNGWDKAATPMSKEGRTWTKTLELPLGKIQYKFVLNDSDWMVDPENKLTFNDGNGNVNSLLINLPDDYKIPAALGDGNIAVSALYHDGTASYLNYDRGQMQFSLRVRPGDIQDVEVEVNGKDYRLSRVSSDDLYEKDEVGVPWDRRTNLTYDFKLKDGKTTEWFGPKGVTSSSEGNQYHVDAKTFQPFIVPDWPEHSVFYQIFPDRFAIGNDPNSPADAESFKPTFSSFFGGNIPGVEQHLGYLKDLGIRAVFFNPIFASHANHRYETDDYFTVDPRFGTNEQFIDLVNKMHADNIKVVLDGVFNHTSTHFFAFKDIEANGPQSKYKDWYFIKSYPVTVKDPPPYVGWFGYSSLPKLHIDNPDTEKYMLSVPQYWDEKAHIDGWRLDAANEVVDSYWRKFRKVVKEDSDQRWITGEIWSDASHWLGGDMYDSVMGYQFRSIALDYFANKATGSKACLDNLMNLYESYPPQVSRNLMNLLGSHDTERFLTLCHGDQKMADLAAAMQLTWPGAPSIYYGDELGMEGGKDPDDRRPMRWDLANNTNPVLSYYKLLVHARDASKALETGDPIPLWASDSSQTLAYGRVDGKDKAIIAINRSGDSCAIRLNLEKMGLANGTALEDVLTGQRYDVSEGYVTLSVQPESALVLLPVKEAESVRMAAR
ncbi:MAG TPA: alpha-amylase family glycosyl hydrolase [Fimbriimonadaceae bacterium]